MSKPKENEVSEAEPLPIFISYASYDNQCDDPEGRWLDRLLQSLKPLELEGKITAWSDNKLAIGQSWNNNIQEAMEQAKVAILLVSPAFLASEYIRHSEMSMLLAKSEIFDNPDYETDNKEDEFEELIILPVVIRPCLINHVSFDVVGRDEKSKNIRLSDLEYVPKSKAMNALSQAEQDEQLTNIALRILEILAVDQNYLIGSMGNGKAHKLQNSMGNKNTSTILGGKNKEDDKLDGLLVRFLKKYDRWWFNAARINRWGALQNGFSEFKNHDVSEIRFRLDYLEKSDKSNIKSKPGKRSVVYKYEV